ncbi:hypothetical protein MY04_2831 [Flammeovirga sp. MY04]|uniref:hypothetical protein n=1 Tax=Flammeovirga sp. MY04 TaxID=1191459 RepID=UPI0008061AD4|nr:hypothetical protein [Flammeovirga sp. MY04]ANQ50199.1 hypothetical protein MY04_2831 [Flammeovirga sp. MY04]
MLKKATTAVLIAITLGLFSCSGNETVSDLLRENHLIYGTWNLKAVESTQKISFIEGDEVIEFPDQIVVYENINITMEFKTDKTVETKGTTDIKTLDEDGSTIITLLNQAVLGTQNWDFDDEENIIIQGADGLPELMIIEKLTETELEVTSNKVQEVDNGFYTQKVEANAYMKLER